MRLINADKIEVRIPACLNGSQMKHVADCIKESLHNAPTVDAIPIEWMEKYADLNRFTTRDGQVIIRFRWIIDEMVADWREALEVQGSEDQGSC